MARLIFCPSTLDINIVLSREEAVKLRRQPDAIPFWDVEHGENLFYVLNPRKTRDYIDVLSRQTTDEGRVYHIKLSDTALDDLLARGTCGIRYDGSSKVNFHLEENL